MNRPPLAVVLMALALPAAWLAVTLNSWPWLAAQVALQLTALGLAYVQVGRP